MARGFRVWGMAVWQAKLMHNGIADLRTLSLLVQLKTMTACRFSVDADRSICCNTSDAVLKASEIAMPAATQQWTRLCSSVSLVYCPAANLPLAPSHLRQSGHVQGECWEGSGAGMHVSRPAVSAAASTGDISSL